MVFGDRNYLNWWGFGEWEKEMGVSDNTRGLILAMASSAFIGSSFILKKKGLKRAADSGTRAGELDCDYVIQL